MYNSNSPIILLKLKIKKTWEARKIRIQTATSPIGQQMCNPAAGIQGSFQLFLCRRRATASESNKQKASNSSHLACIQITLAFASI